MKMIFSNTAHDAYHRVLDELRQRLRGGGEHIVIVPDKFTASSERGVIATLGLDAVFNVRVTSFTRLAEKSMGARIKKCLTPQGSVMLLANVIEENRDNLVFYHKAARSAGFAEEFYAALTALRNSGITPEKLREAARRAPENVRGKFADMALIYERYVMALGDRHSDSTTRLEAYAAWLREGGAVPAHFYVVDLYDFKAPELDILAGLAKSALSLTVGMVSGKGNPNERIYPDGAAERLIAACGGGEVVFAREELHPALDAVSRRLFSYEPPEERVENGGKVRLVSAATRTEEIEFLAREIRAKVTEGARYLDFEVALSDVEGYKAEVKSVFARYGIPFFIDTRELLAEQTKTRCLLSALAAARSGLRRQETSELVKNPLFYGMFGEKEDAAFRFENYCLRYNISFGRFMEPFTLGGEEERAYAEGVRAKLCEVLAPFLFKGETDTADFVARTEKFLAALDGTWREHVARLTETSLYYAKCADQVDEKIMSLLEEMNETLHGKGDVAYFERMLKATVQTVKIALVPTLLDAVYVGGTSNRYLGGGDVYILGANVGKLPAGAEGGAVISEADEALFERLGAPVSPTVAQRNYSEMMSVTEIMKRPKGTLTVCFPESDHAGELRQSVVVSELRGMLAEDGEPIPVRRVADMLEQELCGWGRDKAFVSVLATPKACMHEALAHLSSRDRFGMAETAAECVSEEDGRRLRRIYDRQEPVAKLSAVAVKAARKASGGRISPTRLETLFTCRYMQYFSYILGLKRREEASPESRDFGLVLHGVLEKFFREYMKNGVKEEDVRPLAERFFAESVEENVSVAAAADEPGMERVLGRVREEAVRVCSVLRAQAERSKFKPVYVEQYIGGAEIPALTVDAGGEKAELRGRIDRVDEHDGKFFVIDYKTYKSAELKLADIYAGRKIQLYLYLDAIRRAKGWQPVGAFYLPLSFDFGAEEWRLRYRGNMTDDISVARAMEPLFAEEESLFPAPNANGDMKEPRFLSEGAFDTVTSYVRRLAERGAKEIAEGRIAAQPLKGACGNCDFASVCAWKGRNELALNGGGRIGVDDLEQDIVAPRRRLESSEEEDE